MCVYRSSMDILSSHMSTCMHAPSFQTGCSGKLKPGSMSYKQDNMKPQVYLNSYPTCPAHLLKLKEKNYFIQLIKNLNKWCFGKSYFCFCCSSLYISEAHPNKKDKKEGFGIIGNQKEVVLSLRCFDISFQILLCNTRLLSEVPLWMLFFN